MKNYASDFFTHIYKNYLLNQKSNEILTEFQKTANLIYYEREFIHWLKNKYKDIITENTYYDYCSMENFEQFKLEHIKIENTIEEKNKKESIEEQVKVKELGEVSKYEYDIDIIEAYFNIEELLQNVEYSKAFVSKEIYLKNIRDSVQNYCNKKELPFKTILELRYPLIIDNSISGFEMYLGRTLLAYDVNKIEAILGYQNSKWKGEGLFASFVEHLVYRYIKHNSPFDNNLRLDRIMKWVEKNRFFLTDSESQKKATIEDQYIKKISLPNFFYWPYTEEKLVELYCLLIENDKIEKTEGFNEAFKKHDDFKRPEIVWKTGPTQLMYLLYLIYKQKSQYLSTPLHRIGACLFRETKSEFLQKNLNTIYLQLVSSLNEKDSKSKGLQSIDEIFASLNIE